MCRTFIDHRRRLLSEGSALAGALLLGAGTACSGMAQAADAPPLPAPAILDYKTLDFEDNQTFLTGIRGDNIVGNFIIPTNTSATGGLLYDAATGVWSPFPFATPDMTNYPGSISSSPYGPSFGSKGGILRVVGSYKTDASPFDLGYLYDGAAAPGEEFLTLVYPGASTEFTIAHSTFGNLAVGNYDTGPLTGNAFIYDIAAGTYVTNNIPGEASTTAYGVWGDKIAGGYGGFSPDGEPGFEHGYIYDLSTGTYTTHDHPGAFFTHFEGISGAGEGGAYNLVVDWIGPDGLHAAVLHIDALGNETWIPIAFPGAITTSANSIHQNKVIGVYTDATGVHGFEVTIPGIYNPIHNTSTLLTDASGVTVIDAGPGDDVVNDGSITTTGDFANAISSDRYSVIYNNGVVSVSGMGSAAAVLNGDFPSLLNAGILKAAPLGDAIRSDVNSFGALIVNTGWIDGRINVLSGPQARFENSGWIGLSGAGAGVHSIISGVFVQTAAGTLAPRIEGDIADTLTILGTARLAGTMAPIFQPGDLIDSYTLLTAADITGTFDTLEPFGLPTFLSASLAYGETDVALQLEAELAQVSGLTRNQRAVADALDDAFNDGGGIPDGLNGALFGLSEGQLGAALDSLSGEVYASTQSLLINDAMFGREAVLGRLRQSTHGGASEAQSAFAAAGAGAIVMPAADYGGGRAPEYSHRGPTFWAQGLGAWTEFDGNANVSEASGTYSGFFGGVDAAFGNAILGLAGGYSQSDIEIDDLASSAEVDTAWIAGYAGTSLGRWNLRGGGVYGFHSIDAKRAIGFPGFAEDASADYDAGTGQLFGEIGYEAVWQAISLEPFAGLAWIHLDTDGFRESGGAAALSASSGSADVGYTSLGLRTAVHYPLANGMVLTPRLSAAWQHGFGDLTPTAALAFAATTDGDFTITGVPLARDSALIDARLDMSIGHNASLGVSYLGQLSSTSSSNAVRGHLVWTF